MFVEEYSTLLFVDYVVTQSFMVVFKRKTNYKECIKSKFYSVFLLFYELN